MIPPNGRPVAPPPGRAIFEYNPQTGACSFRIEGLFPPNALVNILEVAKAHCVMAQLQQMMQQPAAPGLCMPDGSPPPRG